MARAAGTRTDKVTIARARSQRDRIYAINLAHQLGGKDFAYPAGLSDALWIARNTKGEVVAMAGTRMEGRDAHFTICGVIPSYRRRGIQQRLIIVRLNWAKRNAVRSVYTYTNRHNLASIASLVKLGFSPFRVDAKQQFVYFGRFMSKPVKRCR